MSADNTISLHRQRTQKTQVKGHMTCSLLTPWPPSHHPNPSSHISLVHVCVYSRKLALYDYFTGNLMYADRQRKTFLNSCHGSEWLLSLRPFKARKKSTTMSSFYPPCLRYYQSKSWEQLWLNWVEICMCWTVSVSLLEHRCQLFVYFYDLDIVTSALFCELIVFVGCWTQTSMPQLSTSSSCCCLWSMKCVNGPSDISLYQVSFL